MKYSNSLLSTALCWSIWQLVDNLPSDPFPLSTAWPNSWLWIFTETALIHIILLCDVPIHWTKLIFISGNETWVCSWQCALRCIMQFHQTITVSSDSVSMLVQDYVSLTLEWYSTNSIPGWMSTGSYRHWSLNWSFINGLFVTWTNWLSLPDIFPGLNPSTGSR